MKKLLLSVFLVLTASFTILANDADLFKLDYNAVQSEFTQLNQLATMVTSNTDLTYSELLATNGNLVTSMRLVPESLLPDGTKNPVLGIPSFLWGCVFNVAGMVVVYLVSDQNMDETKKALWGCITSTVVWVVVDLVWWGAFWRTSSGI
jgi:hypothetical protein